MRFERGPGESLAESGSEFVRAWAMLQALAP